MVKEEESNQVKKKCDYCLRMGQTKEEYERYQAGGKQADGDRAGYRNKVKSESRVWLLGSL